MKKLMLTILILVITGQLIFAQEKDKVVVPDPSVDEYKPLSLKLNKDGSKYIRFILWGQFWLTGTENANNEFTVNANLRRARLLTFAQVSPRFMILLHIGVNSLNENSMDPLGNGSDGPQVFFAWCPVGVCCCSEPSVYRWWTSLLERHFKIDEFKYPEFYDTR